jgi:hypothetical protein
VATGLNIDKLPNVVEKRETDHQPHLSSSIRKSTKNKGRIMNAKSNSRIRYGKTSQEKNSNEAFYAEGTNQISEPDKRQLIKQAE